MVKRDTLGHVIVETVPYLAAARNEGVSDDEREEIAAYISANPTIGEIIQGTGGARKARAAGRSGGYRLITHHAADDIPAFPL
jgi:hypothetical protein